MTFLVCGEALWDLFAEGVPPDLRFAARPGGSPFNVAVGLARLGVRSALLTGLSTDPLGERLAAMLRAEGVDTRFLVRTARPTTLSLVDLGPDGAPAYSFYGTDGADRVVTGADLPALGPEVWGIHAGSFSLVVEPVGSALLALVGRERGRRLVTLDPNLRLTAEPDRAAWQARIGAFLAHADLVKASAEDLALLAPGTEAAGVAAGWLAAGAALVVVTHGAAGAEAFTAAARVTVPAVPVAAADTVGAGDSFMAALLAGLAARGVRTGAELARLGEGALGDLLGLAARAAAETCRRRGADLPRAADLGFRLPAG